MTLSRGIVLAVAVAVAAASTALNGAAAAERTVGPPVRHPMAGLTAPLWTPGAAPKANRRLRFLSIPLFFKKGRVQLSGGKAVVKTDDWRAVAIAREDGRDVCTLTLIGPQVALLAAHCVDAGAAPTAPGPSTIPVEAKFNKHVYDLTCQMSPGYRASLVNPAGSPRASDDFALCDVSRGGADPSALDEVAPESVAASIALAAGVAIQMMGFGCTNLGIDADGRYVYDRSDGTLNIGRENIEAAGISIYPGRPGIFVRASSADGGPVLCQGDSGGPVIMGAPAGPGRRVVAVNSAMGAIDDPPSVKPAFYSYFSPLASTEFAAFAKSWVAQQDLPAAVARKDRRICGIQIPAGAGGCRQ